MLNSTDTADPAPAPSVMRAAAVERAWARACPTARRAWWKVSGAVASPPRSTSSAITVDAMPTMTGISATP